MEDKVKFLKQIIMIHIAMSGISNFIKSSPFMGFGIVKLISKGV